MPGDRRDNMWTAVIELTLGVLVIMALGWTARQRLLGLAAAVPLGLIGAAGFLAGRF